MILCKTKTFALKGQFYFDMLPFSGNFLWKSYAFGTN